MAHHEGLSILDALENLSTLVDAESLEEIEVTEDAHFISHRPEELGGREVLWIHAGGDDLTVKAIRETFRSVHDYLQGFYRKKRDTTDPKTLAQGINTIMVLVGEAAHKLERYQYLFREKVSDLEEYRKLQSFYHTHVVQEASEITWEEELAELLGERGLEEVEGAHLLNDIEVVKKDSLYELFYLKNEAGHHFYTFDLARQVQLACDFGQYGAEYEGDDPLLQVKNWEDRSLHLLAGKILASSKREIDRFYKEALRHKEVPLVAALHNGLMALMLAANPRNLIRQFALKGAHHYFHDFQLFLREALLSREYQQLLKYSPPDSKPFFHDVINLVHSLCYALYTVGGDFEEVSRALKEMASKRGKTPAEGLTLSYPEIVAQLRKHPSGPLFKAFDLIHAEEVERRFDPIMQGNIPEPQGNIVMDGREIKFLRIPSPTHQEYIHRAVIIEEFRTFLYAFHERHERPLLVINMQDRTSWQEHPRCQVLEDLSRHAEFTDVLTVVTLAKDTEFYHQRGSYHDLNDAREFMRQFIDHLGDQSAGFFYPMHIRKVLNFEALVHEVHERFFAKQQILSLQDRLDFIELTYQMLIQQVISKVAPDAIALLSKDSLDVSATAVAALKLFLGSWNDKHWQTELYGPTLLHRERAIHPERFERLSHMAERLDTKSRKSRRTSA